MGKRHRLTNILFLAPAVISFQLKSVSQALDGSTESAGGMCSQAVSGLSCQAGYLNSNRNE